LAAKYQSARMIASLRSGLAGGEKRSTDIDF